MTFLENLLTAAGLSLLGLVALSQPADPVLSELPNVRFPEANRIASGAIDAASVKRLREAGVEHVINLRTAEETPDFDEARAVTEQGMMYHHLPIRGGESLTKENAQKLDALLTQIGDEPALIHCASSNRVGALIALRQAWIKGESSEAAIAEGKRWGLASLEQTVRTLLEQ